MANEPRASDYYAILGLEQHRCAGGLKLEVVKRAYRQTLLKFHPDKSAPAQLVEMEIEKADHLTVDEISLAYKTLSDPKLRAEYDQLIAEPVKATSTGERIHRTGLETVDLDTLDYNEEQQAWTRACRCGDILGFVVTETELELNIDVGELTVGCKGCSLWLRVLFSVEDDG